MGRSGSDFDGEDEEYWIAVVQGDLHYTLSMTCWIIYYCSSSHFYIASFTPLLLHKEIGRSLGQLREMGRSSTNAKKKKDLGVIYSHLHYDMGICNLIRNNWSAFGSWITISFILTEATKEEDEKEVKIEIQRKQETFLIIMITL